MAGLAPYPENGKGLGCHLSDCVVGDSLCAESLRALTSPLGGESRRSTHPPARLDSSSVWVARSQADIGRHIACTCCEIAPVAYVAQYCTESDYYRVKLYTKECSCRCIARTGSSNNPQATRSQQLSTGWLTLLGASRKRGRCLLRNRASSLVFVELDGRKTPVANVPTLVVILGYSDLYVAVTPARVMMRISPNQPLSLFA